MADLDAIRQRAEKALRTPDLEWAHDLVHGLAHDVLALLDELHTAAALATALPRRDRFGEEWAAVKVVVNRAIADLHECGRDAQAELLRDDFEAIIARVDRG